MRTSLFQPALPWVMPAVAIFLLGAGTAGAAVVHVDRSGSPLVVPNTIDGLFLNFITGLTSTTSTPAAGWDFNPYNAGLGLSFFGPDFPSGQGTLVSGATALALLGGETIGGGSIYQPGQALGTNFQITGISYAGLRFQNETTEKKTVATYRSFQINPDGSTNLDTSGAQAWYVSLIDSSEVDRAGGSLDALAPKNYICLQVDPFNGGTRWFQPN